MKPAICCIGYNRDKSMERLLKSIGSAYYTEKDITLIISIDESSTSDQVERVAREFEWKYGDKIIKRYPVKLGLKQHVLSCGDLTEKYGSLIVLEDDLIVSPGFYDYAVSALNFYANDDRIFAISLYYQTWLSNQKFIFCAEQNGSDAFLAQVSVSWGQCWIDKQWKRFREWLNNNDMKLPTYDPRMATHAFHWNDKTSWAKYEYFYLVSNDLYHVIPYISLTTNMGDTGSHTVFTHDRSQTPIFYGKTKKYTFYSFEYCVKYDAFFERSDETFFDTLTRTKKNNTLMDLNGIRYDWSGYKYTYSIQKLPFKSIMSFGAKLDPVELNILLDIPGNAITLYEIPDDYNSPKTFKNIKKYKTNPGRLCHYLNKIPFEQIVANLVIRLKTRILKRKK